MFLDEIVGSPSLETVNLVLKKIAEGEKITSLAIGEPSFDTPREIIMAAYRSMLSGNVHYVSSYGLSDVRGAIRDKVKRKNGIRAKIAHTIFSTTKLSVYAAMLAVSNEPFEALIPDPGYFYSEPVILAGGRPVRYHLADDFSLDVDEIKRKATSKTKAIVVNTPGNPTGKILGRKELTELFGFCSARGIHLVSDEAYEDLVYTKKHFSVGSLEKPEVVISLFSLSKSYAMTGWRAGYVVASETIIHLINKFFENTVSCFPPFIQAASAFALDNCDGRIKEFRRELEARKKLLEEEMASIDALEPNLIEGAFYGFPSYKRKLPSYKVTEELIDKHRVAVLPGRSFGPRGEGHLRISFSASRETIRTGMKGIRTFFRSRH